MPHTTMLEKKLPIAALFGCLAVLLLAGCGGGKSSPCAGAERCACYPNATCNNGLTCLSNVCVNAASGSGGHAGAGTGGAPGAGGSSATGGQPGAGGAPGAGGQLATGGAPGAGGTSGSGGGPGTGGGIGTGGVTAGSGGTVTGTGGVAPGSGGAGGLSDGGVTPGTGGSIDASICRTFDVKPEATVPTVYLLVDRSGSMFQCLTATTDAANCDTTWSVLRTGVLKTVQDLQSVVRFAFGAFGGEKGTTCPQLDKVDAALNNYNAIATLYNSLPAPLKGETPTAHTLAVVKDILTADPTAGPKYILFVTDGQPDYCDDGQALCPVDSVVWRLQQLRNVGISTFVFGIQSALTSTIDGSTLQAFANAGGGMPVAPLTTGTSTNVFYYCQTTKPWMDDHTESGKATTDMSPIGTYIAGGGNTMVYRPDPSNPQALTDLVAGTVSGVKSCTFALVDGLHVDLAQLGDVKVVVQGQTIAHDASNGWAMVSDTQLQLSGNACTLWRDRATHSIDFQFPCGVVTAN